MIFSCTFDEIFEVAPIVRESFDHLIDAAWHIATDWGTRVTLSPTWNLCEGIAAPCFADLTRQMSHRAADQCDELAAL
jgi:hypothetical protein